MSVGQYGGLTRHDMTTRGLLGRAAGSVSPTDAYHAASRQTTQRGGPLHNRADHSLLSSRTTPVSRSASDGYSTSCEHAVWSCRRGVARRPLFVFPMLRGLCTAAGAITRDGCGGGGGGWAWWVPDCDGEGCLLLTSGFKFRLSIINRLIHNRLSIMEKIRK